LHDSTKLESLGIPAVPVATTEFVTAARAQAGALGRSDLDAVYVAHPIQDQSREEIEAKAEAVVEEITNRLLNRTAAS
jgi:alkanesulfonate monooxygenase SsuD/methylene tetrahydromethanopterin reductase-like flavin-dependent oxidoreductase (luciferase family)